MSETFIPPPLRAQFSRVRELAIAGVGDHADSTMIIPRANYLDSDIAAAEMATTFAAVLLAGPSSLVKNPGDYYAIKLIDTPAILTRDQDGQAHVLVNACRHRGAELVEGSGCSRRLTCPYHAWVYDGSGNLVGMPGQEGFKDQDQSKLGLVELPSEERHGFIWTVRDPAGPIDLDAHLGPLDDEFGAWNLEYDVAGTMELTIGANWKCSLEAFQETYHFPYVHKNSMIGQGTVGDVVAYTQFGRHHSLGVPLRGIADGPDDIDVAGERLSIIYYIYPSTVIATSPFGGELVQFYPGESTRESTIRHTVLSRQRLDDDPGVAAFWADYVPVIQAVIRDEDGVVLESAGRGLAAGHFDVIIGANEVGVQGAHRQILADLAGYAG